MRAQGTYERRIDNAPGLLRAACETSLRRLGVERIGLYHCHRRDRQVRLTEVVGAMAEPVQAGKVAALGFSEIGADSLRQAHAQHPIAAVQSEYSLWERGAEAAVLPTAPELGVALVAYSSLGRAVLDRPAARGADAGRPGPGLAAAAPAACAADPGHPTPAPFAPEPGGLRTAAARSTDGRARRAVHPSAVQGERCPDAGFAGVETR